MGPGARQAQDWGRGSPFWAGDTQDGRVPGAGGQVQSGCLWAAGGTRTFRN